MKTKKIGIWKGNNFIELLNLMVCENCELRIKVHRKKLIIKDISIGFYSCTHVGNEVEIPEYEEPILDDDEILVLEEPQLEEPKTTSEQQIQLLREWGLL